MANHENTDGRQIVTIGDLLPDEGVAEVMALYNRGEAVAANLKPVLAKYEAVLAENGVVVGYLAYALEYILSRKVTS